MRSPAGPSSSLRYRSPPVPWLKVRRAGKSGRCMPCKAIFYTKQEFGSHLIKRREYVIAAVVLVSVNREQVVKNAIIAHLRWTSRRTCSAAKFEAISE